jgi:hypothetical protein
MREKLIELLCKAHGMATDASLFEDASFAEQLEAEADYLIQNGVTIQKWIPVTERLPKPNKLVLCWWESGNGEKEHYGFATFQNHGVWYVSNEGMPKVTHWMPLPEPPKEVE